MNSKLLPLISVSIAITIPTLGIGCASDPNSSSSSSSNTTGSGGSGGQATSSSGSGGDATGSGGSGGTTMDGGTPPALADLPACKRSVSVNASAELKSALAGNSMLGQLQPGDCIIAARGVTYSGDFTLDRDGMEGAPITIREASMGNGRATFTGVITLNAAWGGVERLRFTGGGSIGLNGRNSRITRCTWQNATKSPKIDLIDNYGGSHIDHNLVTDTVGAWIEGNGSNLTTDARRNLFVQKNHIVRHERAPNNGVESVIMVLTDSFNEHFFYVEDNLFDDVCNVNPNTGTNMNQREMISIKTRHVIFLRNTIKNSEGWAYVVLRETNDSEISDNVLAGGARIVVRGDNHLIHNNRTDPPSAVGVVLKAGNETMDGPRTCPLGPFAKDNKTIILEDTSNNSCRTAQTCARNATVTNNIGRIILGEDYAPSNGNPYDDYRFKVTNCTLKNNSDAAQRINNSFTNITEDAVNQAVNNTAKEILESDVGPDAP